MQVSHCASRVLVDIAASAVMPTCQRRLTFHGFGSV